MRTKVLGTRTAAPDPWRDADGLAHLVQEMREGRPLCRRGLFRFRSHEEADAWMRAQMIAARHDRRREPT